MTSGVIYIIPKHRSRSWQRLSHGHCFRSAWCGSARQRAAPPTRIMRWTLAVWLRTIAARARRRSKRRGKRFTQEGVVTPIDIVRAAIPGISDREADAIIWGGTAFPFRVSAREIFKAARRSVRARDSGVLLCDHCNNRADFDAFECKRCHDARTRAWPAA